jgi:hypothetical protein
VIKMKLFIIAVLVFTNISWSFAQSTCAIKKAGAYFNVSLPGIQMVDDNGNPVPVKPIINRFIYVEYTGLKMPEIKAVLYNGSELSFNVIGLKEKTVQIGDKGLNPNNSFSVKKGNSMLKIELQYKEGKTIPDRDCKSIVIKSKIVGRTCRFYVIGEKEFRSFPSY